MRKKNPLLQVQSDPLHVQEARETKPTTELKEIDHEIECPRCHEVMILSSGFDRLGYSCAEEHKEDVIKAQTPGPKTAEVFKREASDKKAKNTDI